MRISSAKAMAVSADTPGSCKAAVMPLFSDRQHDRIGLRGERAWYFRVYAHPVEETAYAPVGICSRFLRFFAMRSIIFACMRVDDCESATPVGIH